MQGIYRFWGTRPVFLGRVDAHRRVERSCLALFASPTPVYEDPHPCQSNSAELGMTHLDRTEWESAEYRKRDFFIQCGSDNVGICGI
ncbi:hypothetical protein GOBAR_AA04955 [Gossypium barbadense]|uniref:Uncharacterized protein n=1 Tax=Gossypium barbadense TaxID=3634 RepID=A0A2P5YJ54_GOSBA|nr:hypothetical protein GOBAR_AA04955 [Gossypium barbadense]